MLPFKKLVNGLAMNAAALLGDVVFLFSGSSVPAFKFPRELASLEFMEKLLIFAPEDKEPLFILLAVTEGDRHTLGVFTVDTVGCGEELNLKVWAMALWCPFISSDLNAQDGEERGCLWLFKARSLSPCVTLFLISISSSSKLFSPILSVLCNLDKFAPIDISSKLEIILVILPSLDGLFFSLDRKMSPWTHNDACFSSRKCCWGPMMEPGRQILIQAMISACVNL